MSESRLTMTGPYQKPVYLETLAVFLGANFVYHQQHFRRTRSAPAFFLFMCVNAFTSFQLCEATNNKVIHWYAIAYNNTKEMQHRNELNRQFRLQLWR